MKMTKLNMILDDIMIDEEMEEVLSDAEVEKSIREYFAVVEKSLK